MKRIRLVRPLLSAVLETRHNKLFGYMQGAGLVLAAAHTAVEGFSDGSGVIAILILLFGAFAWVKGDQHGTSKLIAYPGKQAAATNAVPAAGFVANGAGGAPKAAEALATVTGNYAACNRTADRLDALAGLGAAAGGRSKRLALKVS